MLFLLACGYKAPADDTGVIDTIPDTDTTDDTGTTVPEDLGDPYLAMVAAVQPGILSTTCSLNLTVYEDDVVFAQDETTATGGEWVGVQLSGDHTYTASGSYSACTELDPDGDTLESGRFSGVAGFMFVFWFNGANAGYASLEQTVDFNGGRATIVLAEGADPSGIQAIATPLGVNLSQRAAPEDNTWDAVFLTDLPVGRVLSEFSADPAFVSGSPEWIDAPTWW